MTPDTRDAIGRWFIVVGSVAAIGLIDYATGTEVRVMPLYFVPVGVGAWHFGRAGGVAASVLSAGMWAVANYLGGVVYSAEGIWAVNIVVQFLAFGVVGLLIAEVRQAERYQATLARVDPLTGLLNRRALYDIGARVCARCRKVQLPVAIAYIDLDGFKGINDTAGHEAGDRLLKEVADRLQLAVRPTDLVARLGGDEFAILLPELRPESADTALERVRAAVSAVLTPAGAPVTASIGAVGFTDPPDHLDGMIARADEALYRAKREGRNRARYELATS
ncbi:MAG TPA: diguanylate cyclase [Gemmatimonadaceae bacterium]|nr:diguanylate cyclase [Gemmatimonadaceae bacterium]